MRDSSKLNLNRVFNASDPRTYFYWQESKHTSVKYKSFSQWQLVAVKAVYCTIYILQVSTVLCTANDNQRNHTEIQECKF